MLLYLHRSIHAADCKSLNSKMSPVSQKEDFVTVFWIDLTSVL